ncbi:serine protease, ClpP class [Hydrobacter penzbergensis]|uniref:Serine protease, ClpP class n=1 Tax=Hydrobacter penzbergensis TaxID=1235997 RepID=A0A8X8LEZ9_9BACT|nr:serine protease [Hydrobacter penzbergensis]SDX46076.1 serine protease, ClpP class [Hydrobacter penzbergensis]
MPNWKEVLQEIQEAHKKDPATNPLDTVRRKYLASIEKHTGRNVIAYYSGWLQRPGYPDTSINDKDKNAFMVNIHKMDRDKGLDLILHTPGGDLAATESIVDYLKAMFGNNIRAIIPQISMSAGTMIALSCREIMLGKQSNLGPIDPQMGGIACQAVLDEFKQALSDVKANPSSASLWQVIIGKYHPTFLTACKQAIDWSKKMVKEWLTSNMLKGKSGVIINKVLKEFGDHSRNKSHARHISKQKCKTVGLKIIDMETDDTLQDLILTVHHAFMHTFASTNSIKIVENQFGVAYMENLPVPVNAGQ